MENIVEFLKQWWALVLIPTLALVYLPFSDWRNSREVFEITGLRSLALYDLRSDDGVEVPEFASMIVLEVTNTGRTSIYLSRADCLVDGRATRLVHPLEVLCLAFAGRPQSDNLEFVRANQERPNISNIGLMSEVPPVEMPPGSVGYVTLVLLHHPEPPFPEGQQIRLSGISTHHWASEDEVPGSFRHYVAAFRNLDVLYDNEVFRRLIGNEVQSFVGANVWLETTNGTRLEPLSIASIVFSEGISLEMGRAFLGLPVEAVGGN